ncbi:MAG TPA: DUF2845 domain-containing protein [Steroidobacteraceae bacterium]
MKRSLAMASVLFLLPLAASADESFRCGNWIASSSMSVEELLQKCGEPTSRSTQTEDVMVRNRDNGLMTKVGETQIETWIYERGSQAAAMVVTIVDGRIKKLERQK